MRDRLFIVYFAVMVTIASICSFNANAATFPNLTIACDDPSVTSGQTRKVGTTDRCKRVIYVRPAPNTLIRKISGDLWITLSTLQAAEFTQICKTPLEEGSLSDPASGAPCVAWAETQKSTLVLAPTINTSGTINLEWEKVTRCIDHSQGDLEVACDSDPTGVIKGYRVFSGVALDQLTLLQTVTADVLKLAIPGYASGTYFFAVQAFNSDSQEPNGPQSGIASVTVQKAQESRLTPIQVKGVVITVTF